MDVTLLPPSTILSHHSHHLYHAPPALLPSPMNKRNWSHFVYPKLMSGLNTYRYRRRPFESLPPPDGSSPIAQLPDELWLEILKHLGWSELLAIRSVDRRLANLAISSSLHHTLSFSTLPPLPLPPLLTEHLLPAVRHLHFHLFPYPAPNSSHPTAALFALLNAIPPGQLRTLSLPFSSPYIPSSELGELLPRVGGKLEKLDLRGSGVSGRRWTDWLRDIGRDGRGLQDIDLGFTIISSLPLSQGKEGEIDPFRNLRQLSLASCTHLPASVLTTFLANLPPTITSLDLSRLEQIPFSALWALRVTHRLTPDDQPTPTALTNIKLVGIDHLTRTDIRRLKRHWESQRRSCTGLAPVSDSVKTRRVWGEPSTSTSASMLSRGLLTPPRTPTRSVSPLGDGVSSASNRLQEMTGGDAGNAPDHPFALGLLTPPPSVSPPPRKAAAIESPDKIAINITHSAILESEDEAGYRQFIGEVAGAVILPANALALEEEEGLFPDSGAGIEGRGQGGGGLYMTMH